MKIIKRRTLYSPDAPDEPYLIRWTLFSCRWFDIKLHRILRSDNAPLHDHPWNFASFMLSSGYVETLARARDRYETPEGSISVTETFRRRRFSLAFRKAEDRHRIVLDTRGWNADHAGPPVEAWTLVFTGRRRREWYFYPMGVRVPWRVQTMLGDAAVDAMIKGGWTADAFATYAAWTPEPGAA